MNIRALLHTVAETCTLIAGGSVVLHGFDPHTTDLIVSTAVLVSVSVNRYMALTTQGSAKAKA